LTWSKLMPKAASKVWCMVSLVILYAIDFKLSPRTNVVHGRFADGAGILNADFWLVLLLAGMTEGNQGRFLNNKLSACEEGILSLGIEGKL
jgi:hypothetical protein